MERDVFRDEAKLLYTKSTSGEMHNTIMTVQFKEKNRKLEERCKVYHNEIERLGMGIL